MNRDERNRHKAFEDIRAKPAPEKPQEDTLKRHGDALQSAVDKATSRDNRPH